MSDSQEENIVEDRFGVEAPAELDGVDLHDGCPECGHDDWEQMPAGYYTCTQCFSTWAGDPADASLVTYLSWDGGETA
jgi:hypothetical protein